jgi:hypothetical protein
MRLLLDKAPRLIRFRLELVYPHVAWMAGKLYMEVIRARRKALHHEVQQPGATDAHRTADPAQRDALTEQGLNQRALLVRSDGGIGVRTELALTRFAVMILFTMAGLAIFLVPLGSTRWTRFSDDHGFRWPPWVRTVFDQQ